MASPGFQTRYDKETIWFPNLNAQMTGGGAMTNPLLVTYGVETRNILCYNEELDPGRVQAIIVVFYTTVDDFAQFCANSGVPSDTYGQIAVSNVWLEDRYSGFEEFAQIRKDIAADAMLIGLTNTEEKFCRYVIVFTDLQQNTV